MTMGAYTSTREGYGFLVLHKGQMDALREEAAFLGNRPSFLHTLVRWFDDPARVQKGRAYVVWATPEELDEIARDGMALWQEEQKRLTWGTPSYADVASYLTAYKEVCKEDGVFHDKR